MRILQCNDSFRPIMDGVGVCMENYARHLGLLGHNVAVAAPWAPKSAGSGESDTVGRSSRRGESGDAGQSSGRGESGTTGPAERDSRSAERRDPFTLFRYASIPLPGWKPYRLGVPRLDLSFHIRLSRWIDTVVEAESGGSAAERRLQIVHSHSPFVAGKLAQRIARRHDALHVTTFHSKYRDDFLKSVPSDNLASVFVERIVEFYDSADAVWTPSEATAETLRNYGFSGEVTVMPNGADLEPPDDAGYQAFRRRGAEVLGAPLPEEGRDKKASFILLFVGQHRWEKNIRLIIDGLAELSGGEQRPIRAIFAGTGADAKEIEGYAKKRGVRELCDFRGLVLDRELLKAFYARADLFIFPSLYDNAPLVLREAAAFRSPAILAAGSSAAADTEDGKNAFHVEPEPRALASLITKLSRQEEEVRRVGLGARHEVYRGWGDIVADVANRYEALLSTGRAG